MYPSLEDKPKPTAWNKTKLNRQKRPLKLQEIYAVRIRLQIANKLKELALFNLTILRRADEYSPVLVW